MGILKKGLMFLNKNTNLGLASSYFDSANAESPPTTASVGIIMKPDGTFEIYRKNVFQSSGDWYDGDPSGSDFEIRVTLSRPGTVTGDGDLSESGTTAGFIPFNSDVNFGASLTQSTIGESRNNDDPDDRTEFTITIKSIPSNVEEDSIVYIPLVASVT